MNNFEIFEKDVFKYQTFLNFNKKFDIIFLDPPYRNKSLENLLINIYSSNILNNEGIIIIHRHKKEEDIVPKNYKILEKKYYGISKIIFLTIFN
jgi:16S rRNA (guanine966-N2)-methyltransferase